MGVDATGCVCKIESLTSLGQRRHTSSWRDCPCEISTFKRARLTGARSSVRLSRCDVVVGRSGNLARQSFQESWRFWAQVAYSGLDFQSHTLDHSTMSGVAVNGAEPKTKYENDRRYTDEGYYYMPNDETEVKRLGKKSPLLQANTR